MESENFDITPANCAVTLAIKRDDLIHPTISGNKFRKLKYNLLEARQLNFKTLLTFGGAFSNHIAATAAAGKEHNFKTIGIIRGEELRDQIENNPTLKFAEECGMKLHFVSRNEYNLKSSEGFQNKLKHTFGDFYLLPEGGTNSLAIKGCEEILNRSDDQFDYICCAAGTGGTAAGIINSTKFNQKVLVFPALKGDFLKQEIAKFATNDRWELVSDYHFGGYAKVSEELIHFINEFLSKYNIPLDPIYTGKMVFGVIDLIRKGYFPDGSKVLAVHTGGIQGIAGMNIKLKTKKLPLIQTYD